MKKTINSKPYFSAYSLNAMNAGSETDGAKTQNKQFSRVINRVVVSPVENAYAKKLSINNITIPLTVQSGDKNWFINYE